MSMVEKETKVVNENKMMVNMTKEALYDFLLFHAYSKFSGFLVNILGLAVAFMGIFSYTTCFFALILSWNGVPPRNITAATR